MAGTRQDTEPSRNTIKGYRYVNRNASTIRDGKQLLHRIDGMNDEWEGLCCAEPNTKKGLLRGYILIRTPFGV